MIFTTTPHVEGREIARYCGIVTGEAIIGANLFSDLFAKVRDIVGGRSGAYEKALSTARREAFADLEHEAEDAGADAVIGIDLDYETIGDTGSMLMVSISGTAVKLR